MLFSFNHQTIAEGKEKICVVHFTIDFSKILSDLPFFTKWRWRSSATVTEDEKEQLRKTRCAPRTFPVIILGPKFPGEREKKKTWQNRAKRITSFYIIYILQKDHYWGWEACFLKDNVQIPFSHWAAMFAHRPMRSFSRSLESQTRLSWHHSKGLWYRDIILRQV